MSLKNRLLIVLFVLFYIISAICFLIFSASVSFRVGGAPDMCVDSLLEASVKYSPHFDWVVAHIG